MSFYESGSGLSSKWKSKFVRIKIKESNNDDDKDNDNDTDAAVDIDCYFEGTVLDYDYKDRTTRIQSIDGKNRWFDLEKVYGIEEIEQFPDKNNNNNNNNVYATNYTNRNWGSSWGDDHNNNNNNNNNTATAMTTRSNNNTSSYSYGGYAGTYNTSNNYTNNYSSYNNYYNNYNSNTVYIPPQPKYKAKSKNANSLVTFVLICDEKAMKKDDKVFLTGSLDSLTNWGRGIEMLPSSDININNNTKGNNKGSCYWEVSVNIPFNERDISNTGIFHIRYDIHPEECRRRRNNNNNNDDDDDDDDDEMIINEDMIINEGQSYRIENEFARYYFHKLRSNYRERRFTGFVSMNDEKACSLITRIQYEKYRDGHFNNEILLQDDNDNNHGNANNNDMIKDASHQQQQQQQQQHNTNNDNTRDDSSIMDTDEMLLDDAFISLRELYTRLICLGKSSLGERDVAENLFNKMCEKKVFSNSPELLLALMGFIGSHGLTSHEKNYNTYGNTQYSTNTRLTTTYYKSPSKPTRWCHFVVKNLDMKIMCVMNLRKIFGKTYHHILVGFKEMIERFTEHGYHSWMHIVPFMRKHTSTPDMPDVTRETNERFLDVCSDLITLVNENYQEHLINVQLQIEMENKARIEAESQGRDYDQETKMLKNNDDDNRRSKIPLPLFLSQSWMHAMILYVPSVDKMLYLGSNYTDLFREFSDEILPSLCERLEEFTWTTRIQIDTLLNFLDMIPQFKTAEVATSILKNKTLDDLPEAVIQVVKACVTGKTFCTSSSHDEKNKNSNDETTSTTSTALKGKWLTLNTATKEWIHRRHAAEPDWRKKTSEANRSNNNYYSNYNDNWNWSSFWNADDALEDKSIKASESEIAQRRFTDLVEACLDVHRLFEIAFYTQNSRGILFELSRCWMFKGDYRRVIKALCTFFAGGTDVFDLVDISEFTIIVTDFISGTIWKMINQNSNSLASALKILKVIRIAFENDIVKSFDYLYILAISATWPSREFKYSNMPSQYLETPPLNLILVMDQLWISLFEQRNKSNFNLTAGEEQPQHVLIQLLVLVEESMRNITSKIIENKIDLKTLQFIASQHTSFVDLLDINEGFPDFTDILTQKIKAVHNFDMTLEHLLCYSSLFCNCGVRIETLELRKQVETIRTGYNDMISCDLDQAFDWLKVAEDISWLHNLRSSELFLYIWKSAGIKICYDEAQKSIAIQQAEQAQLSKNDTTTEEMEANLDGLNLLFGSENTDEEEVQEEETEKEKKTPTPMLTPEEEAKMKEDILFEDLDDNSIFDIFDIRMASQDLEEIVLTQEQVSTCMIPLCKKVWMALIKQSFDGTLIITRLEQTYSKMESAGQLLAELKLMSHSVPSSRLVESNVIHGIQKTQNQLKDYLLLKKLTIWLPNLVRLHELVRLSLIVTTTAEDELRVVLDTILDNIKTKWQTLKLNDIPEMISVFRVIFEKYDDEQIDFLSTFAECPALVNWLIKHDCTDEFNRMLQVCRPCTDEPRLLSAIASLVHIRTLLLDILYNDPPFEDYKAFTESFQELELEVKTVQEQSGIWHLKNVIGSFESLIDVFEKQTKSPGIKSCYDLKSIMEGGTFILQSNPIPREVFTLEVVEESEVNDHEDGDGKICEIDASIEGINNDETKETDTTKNQYQKGDESNYLKIINRKVQTQKIDYLLDLRSKLLMTEIPEELEEEIQASAMVDAFTTQLQLLMDMSDIVSDLCNSGHLKYQKDFEVRYSFKLDGYQLLQNDLQLLQEQRKIWKQTVKDARDKYFFLNFLTMREVLQMQELLPLALESYENRLKEPVLEPPVLNAKLTSKKNKKKEEEEIKEQEEKQQQQQEKISAGKDNTQIDKDNDIDIYSNEIKVEIKTSADSLNQEAPASTCKENEDTKCHIDNNQEVSTQEIDEQEEFKKADEILAEMITMGFQEDWSRTALRKCNNVISDAIDFCFANNQYMDRIVAEDIAEQKQKGFLMQEEMKGEDSFNENIVDKSAGEINITTDNNNVKKSLDPYLAFISMLHLISSQVDEILVKSAMIEWKEKVPGNKTSLLVSMGEMLGHIFGRTLEEASTRRVNRSIPKPTRFANNLHDMIINVSGATEKRLPIFVTCATSDDLVIDSVLSVYARRGRLPEPAEVIFCTTETTIEDLEIFVRRFIKAKLYGRQDDIYCLADLHFLSYTQQCTFVQYLRMAIQEYTTDEAATLLLISGRAQQLILNSLSAQSIELPPLDKEELRTILHSAFKNHCGETKCIASTINGGGKTHHIMADISKRQSCGSLVLYKKLPINEATNTSRFVDKLLSSDIRDHPAVNIAFHLDISHIIPTSANTILFQLLVVGVLRDAVSCRVYHRRTEDTFLLEIPNSSSNKTAKALHVCSLLPAEILSVTEETIQMKKPVLVNEDMGTIVLADNIEIKLVSRWLRAFKNRIFRPGDSQKLFWSPWNDEAIADDECFQLLSNACCSADGPSPNPSWSIFNSFVMYMYHQLNSVEGYALLDAETLSMLGDGFEYFKHSFINMLIATGKDFSCRSVKQADKVGPDASELNLGFEETKGGGISTEDDGELPGPLVLQQQGSNISITMQDAEISTLSSAVPVILQNQPSELALRFENMLSWDNCEHPFVVFNMDNFCQVEGVDILSLNPSFIDRYIGGELRHSLQENFIQLARDWSKLSNLDGVQILRSVQGNFNHGFGGLNAMDEGYVLTVDNLLKMLSIQMRLRADLPVIIMGETGCGKSTLLRNLCAILGIPLHTLNVHGGMGEDEILLWMNSKITIAKNISSQNKVIVFLDEVNTCNCMGLFKEIVCDKTMQGVKLPSNICVIAACNPYRLRTAKSLYGGEEMAGLTFEHYSSSDSTENVGTGIKDPLRNLVYRVHPLPESMIDYIFDFGALSDETESLYIKAMITKKLGALNNIEYEETQQSEIQIEEDSEGEEVEVEVQVKKMVAKETDTTVFVDVFGELISVAQENIREFSGDRSAASLRDVARCLKVFLWFGNHFAKNFGVVEGWTIEDFYAVDPKAYKSVRKAVILSIAYCYHARLPRNERSILIESICLAYKEMQPKLTHQQNNNYGYNYAYGFNNNLNRASRMPKPKCKWLQLDPQGFTSVLGETQRAFVGKMNLEDGIALNEALCENLFMILVSVLNQIPIFVIGKPGSSKSLAMGLVQANLNGDASDNDFLKSLPAVEVFSYQCSPLSTSGGIEQAFESARRYKREAENTVVVLLLDEVGLAEQSPHLPLKVLHKVLDESIAGESVVGISNWALDPAKMNRAVHLYRPAPTVEDLSMTAEGMVRSANLKAYLQALARAYNEVYHGQEHADFWGLREFYSTVRAINSLLNSRKILLSQSSFSSPSSVEESKSTTEDEKQAEATTSNEVALDSMMLLEAICRNFGGRPSEIEKVLKVFFDNLGLPIPYEAFQNQKIENLIKQNLAEQDARHLMLLTKNNAALDLLFDRSILGHNRTEVIFGSEFPLDKTDLQICLNIQQIKHYMAEGITVVLVYCESLYESLYDLLNQHYCEYGGQLYVRLAFGTHSQLCPLKKSFRVVVVVEKYEAYTKLAPPLLNRFEKQVFERKDALEDLHQDILERLRSFVRMFGAASSSLTKLSVEEAIKKSSFRNLRAALCGYHGDLLSSLILATERQVANSKSGQDAKSASEYEALLFNKCVESLLWIAPPEAVCRLVTSGAALNRRIEEDFDIDVAKQYFKTQRHSSLPTFLDSNILEHDEWRDEIGSQSIIMTYSPLNQHVHQILKDQTNLDEISHITLHQLDMERELKQKVNDFFLNASNGSVLVLQCDPLAASLRRIEHAKFICEKARAKYASNIVVKEEEIIVKKEESGFEEIKSDVDGKDILFGNTLPLDTTTQSEDRSSDHIEVLNLKEQQRKHDLSSSGNEKVRGIHIIILVHLPRSGDLNYCVGFDTRWRFAFVDSLISADFAGLPEVENMIGRSMVDIFKDLNHAKVLLRSFRLALSRLQYKFGRTNEEVRSMIQRLILLFKNSDFMKVIEKLMVDMLTDGGDDLEISSDLENERALTLAGTFQASLHAQVIDSISKMLAIVLSHMDRNGGLLLFGERDELRTMWLYLFKKSFRDMNIFSTIQSTTSVLEKRKKAGRSRKGDNIEVANDALDKFQIFEARFPFSFFISRMIDSMRSVTEESDEETLLQQIQLFNLECNIGDEDLTKNAIGDDLLSRYTHDITCMYFNKVEGLSRDEQYKIVWNSLIDKRKGEFPKNISSIHFRLWHVQRFLQLYFNLLNTVPQAVSPVCEYLTGSPHVVETDLHIHILESTINSLSPKLQEWKTEGDVLKWLAVIESCTLHVSSILDLILTHENLKELLLNSWYRLQFLSHFVYQVALPMRMSPTEIEKELIAMEKLNVVEHSMLRYLLKLLSKLNMQMFKDIDENTPVEYICGLSKIKMVDPVLASDGYHYDSYALQKYFSNGGVISPATGDNFANQLLRPNPNLKAKIISSLACNVRGFLEYYIFDKLFPTQNRLDTYIVVDLVNMLSETFQDISIDIDEKYLIAILPSEGCRLGLLRELMDLKGEKQARLVEVELLKAINKSVGSAQVLDSSLAVWYATVIEESVKLDSNVTIDIAKAWKKIIFSALSQIRVPLTNNDNKEKSTTFKAALNGISKIRFTLARFANLICRTIDTEENKKSDDDISFLLEERELLVKVVNEILLDSGDQNIFIIRSMRIFLLKQIERSRGLSFTRSVLLQKPLSDMEAVRQWYKSKDIGFIRFIGSNKLPQENPLATLPLFSKLKVFVELVIKSGEINKFGQEINTIIKDHGEKAVKANLISVLFHEVALLLVVGKLENSEEITNNIDALHKYIETSPCFSFCTKQERNLMLLFSGSQAIKSPVINLSIYSSPEMILRVRYLAHFSSAVMSADDNNPLSFFKSIIFNPLSLKDNYFPTMPEDQLKMAQEALGGRWYNCPNNHPFYVDYCGRPTVIQKCAECGEEIGGNDHSLLDTNKDIGEMGNGFYLTTSMKDNSEKNYCIPESAEAKEKLSSIRNVSAVSIRAIRLLLHSSMIIGTASLGQWSKDAESFLNKGFCSNIRDLSTFFVDHFKSDWNLLKEMVALSDDDISSAMHVIVEKSIEKDTFDGIEFTTCKNLTEPSTRSTWENAIKKVSEEVLERENLQEKLTNAMKKWGGKISEADGLFKAELLEKIDLFLLPAEERKSGAPALWRHRRPFTLDHFTYTLNLQPSSVTKYPILNAFLAQESQLKSLQYLPQVLEWTSLLLKKFNKRFDRETARKTTVADILNSHINEMERYQWRNAFNGWASAWNHSWQYVQRYGCLEIPKEFAQFEMRLDSPITFSLPGEQDEGICSLAFLRYLVDKHNDFNQMVRENMLLRGRDEISTKAKVVSSRHFTPTHAVKYCIEGDLEPFIEKQCLHIMPDGIAKYDFSKAEMRLVEAYFGGKPAIDLEIQAFSFSLEQHLSGSLGLLRQKLKQVPLTRELIAVVKRDLDSPAKCQNCLEILETTISFLTATGGGFVRRLDYSVANMPLGVYLHTVLLMTDVTRECGSKAISQDVKLMHLESFWYLLTEITSGSNDIWEGISIKYKKKIECDKMKEKLKKAAKEFQLDLLLPNLKSFIKEQLKEEFLNANQAAHEVVGYILLDDLYLNQVAWFSHWPADLQLENLVDTYCILEECIET